MRKLAVGLVIMCLLLAGCAQSPPSEPQNVEPEVQAITPTPTPHQITATPEVKEKTNGAERLEPPAFLYDRTWISPGKVMVGNFHAGARAEHPLSIHNGSDKEATFSVSYREASHTNEEYPKAPKVVQDWVIIADTTPVIAPKATEDIMVAIVMPEDAIITEPKFEFWIVVRDTTQAGMVQTELGSRWLVSMRVE